MNAPVAAFRYEAMPNWWIYDETDVTVLDEDMPEELRPDGAYISGEDYRRKVKP